jgi:hypothetical protein
VSEALLFGVETQGAAAFNRQIQQLDQSYKKLGSSAGEASRKASEGGAAFKQKLAGMNREMASGTSVSGGLLGKLGGFAKGAIAGAAAAGVAFLTTKLVEMAQKGAEAARVAATFVGQIEPLREDSFGLIDDTSLQKFDALRRELHLTGEEYKNILVLAAERESRGLGDATDSALKALKGEAEGLREIGLVIDTSTKAYEGLTEAQKKAQVAREVAAAGAKINRDEIEIEALALEQGAVSLENFISDIQVFVFETLQSSGALDLMTDALEMARGFFDRNSESIERLADVAVRLVEMGLTLLGDQLDNTGSILEGLVIPALELATDLLEIMLPVVRALLNPIDTLGKMWDGFVDTLSFTNSQADTTVRYLDAIADALKDVELQALATTRAMGPGLMGAVGESTELIGSGLITKSTLAQARSVTQLAKNYSEAYDMSEQLYESEIARYEAMGFSEDELQKKRDFAWDRAEERMDHINTYYDSLKPKDQARKEVLEEQLYTITAVHQAQEGLNALFEATIDREAIGERMLDRFRAGADGVFQEQLLESKISARESRLEQPINQQSSGPPPELGQMTAGLDEWNTVTAEANANYNELISNFSGDRANALGEGILVVANAFEAAAASLSESAGTMQEAFAAYRDGSMSVVEVGSIVAESALRAGQAMTNAVIKDKKAQATVNALFEGAMAVAAAARLDFVAAAGHTLAAIKFGAIAGGGAGAEKSSAASSAKTAERQRERREATRFTATERADGFGDREKRTEIHNHFHSLDPRGGFEMAVDTLNKGAKRRTGRYIDGRLLGAGAAGGI